MAKADRVVGYPLAEANGNEIMQDSLPSHSWDGSQLYKVALAE